MAQAEASETLKPLLLDALWRARAKKFGGFAGYDMPLEFEGLIPEHNWTRTNAGLFDVSHMGPCFLSLNEGMGEPGAHERVAAIIETLVPADIAALELGQVRYSQILNAEGGVLDDLMIARAVAPERAGMLYIVVNAGCKEQDFALIAKAAGSVATLERADDQVLLALQGPKAHEVMARLAPETAEMTFMTTRRMNISGARCLVARSGYTGEDGFEVLVHPDEAKAFAELLLAQPEVKPIGLGARDSLRLEAGLCLYGHELDETISPIEAGLAWSIQKSRREAANFPGAQRILRELKEKPARKRVGIKPLERAPAREGVEIQANGVKIGVVCSGGFSPTLNAPISMGYVTPEFSKVGTRVDLIVRGQARPAEIVSLPFVPHRYARKP